MTSDNNHRLALEKILSLCFPDLNKDNIAIDSPDTKGDGYLSSISFADVTSKGEVLHLVIKLAHQREEQRNFIHPTEVFERESYFYTTFCSAIREHQNEKSVKCGFSSVPKCYGTYLANKTEAIILQDLGKLGYKLWDRKKPMDEQHLTKVLEEYGKLHASSFAMKKQQPQRFENITSSLRKSDIFTDVLQQTDVLLAYYLRFEQIIQLLESKERKKDAQKVKKIIREISEVLLQSGEPNDKYSVVLHGDCWNNNIMFFYDDGNDKPTKMCFLDFQLSRLASPLLDFSYFFYTCAPKHALDDINKYLKIYYNSLSNCLEAYGCNSDDAFPYSVFIEHWRKYSKFGLLLSLIIFRLTLCDKEEVPDLASDGYTNAFKHSIKNEDVLNERTFNVLNHFIENNLI